MLEFENEEQDPNDLIENKFGKIGDNKDNMNYAHTYIDYFLKINSLNSDNLWFNKKLLPFCLNYLNKLISINLNSIKNNQKRKIIINKRISRNINYLNKALINTSFVFQNKIVNESVQKLITSFFVLFNYNLLNYILQSKKISNNNKKDFISQLNYLLNNISNIIGISYLKKAISDEHFESILKFLLSLSYAKNIEKEPIKNDEITNIMFFKCSINLIKIVFNKLNIMQNDFTQRQEQLINNIIIFINENILGSSYEGINLNYINKIFLSENDSITSLLLDLSYIISKIKSDDIKNNFINLITDIYSFSFKYNNGMRQTLQLLEPLFININKKKLNQIKNEINISDLTLSFINSLISKEKIITKKNTCMLRQGFYFGNEYGGITYDLDFLENEFIIMFGFSVEPNNLDSILLFDIRNQKKNISQIKFYLSKTINNNIYDMIAADSTNEMSTKINIHIGKTYIFVIHFITKKHSCSVKINYIKSSEKLNKGDSQKQINSGKDFKIKNFKNENLSLFFGCENIRIKRENKIQNKFRGFLGDIIILNTKNIKEKNEGDFDKYLLSLEGNYYKILSLFEENLYEFYSKNTYTNSYIYKLKEIYRLSKKNIQIIISPKLFESIEYQDNIDYINITDYERYIQKKITIFKINRKYLDLIIKPDTSEKDKFIIINTSLFDKKFHIFKNELTLFQFINYDGIHYLSLLLEYYYQVICHLLEIKQNYNIEEIKNICKDINEKILNVLYFFDINIIKNRLFLNKWEETNQFLYQMAVTLLKFIEIGIINIQTIKYLVDLLNTFDKFIGEYINKNINLKEYLTIRKKLFDFLLNPKLYKEIDDSRLEKINYTILNLLVLIKINSEDNTIEFMEDIFKIEILNKLLSFIWLLDFNDSNINNDNNNINDENSIKNDNIFLEKARHNYILLLIELLKSSFPKNIDSIKYNSEKNLPGVINQNSIKDVKSSKLLIIKEDNTKFEKINKTEKLLINYFFDKIIEQRKNKNIFFNMSIILSKTNLINELEESEIEKIKLLLIKELNEKDEKNNDKKNLIYLSCLMILIEFYFSEFKNKSPNKFNKVKRKKNDFHTFIKGLNLNLDLFYSLMNLFKYVQNLSINIDFEINNKNNENKNKNIINYGIDIKELSKSYIPTFSGLTFMEINIRNLNESKVTIIIHILEDIIYLLYKLEKKNIKKDSKSSKNNDDSFNSSLDGEQTGKDIYEILKKNIDIIFKFPESELYNQIFSSENEICAELFYLKLKLESDEGINYIEKAIMKYHKDLLKKHCCSFIFKFLFFLSNEKALPFGSNFDDNKNKIKLNKLRVNLMIFIIETLYDYQKELNGNNENMIIYLNNLINFLIVINQELDYNKNLLFKNNKFCEALYKFTFLIEKSGLLYSNYYIELNENYGKIISESIYDLFFAIYDKDFNEEIFTKIFIKYYKKEEEIYTIFYLIDLYKKKVLEKEKKVKELLNELIPGLSILKYFHEYIFLNDSKKRIKLFLNKKVFPIEDVNFSIYFLAKSFIYFNSSLMRSDKKKIKHYLMNNFLPLLSKNIFRLYTKRNNFYGNKRCQRFPLYNFTKQYFESYLVQNPNDFGKFELFFKTDMKINLKEEYNIFYCYSSRLLHDIKKIKPIDIKRDFFETDKVSIKSNTFCVNNINELLDNNNELNISTNSLPFLSTKSTYKSNLKDLYLSNKSLTLKSYDSKSSDEILLLQENENEENDFYDSFELIKKNYFIYNPKNFFFKKIFSDIFKNIIFNDNMFKKIKNVYLIKNRKEQIIYKESKQLNFPIKQRNFSNFLEPKIFIKRDSNFYNNEFFSISHDYIKKELLNENIENIFFYKHKYKFLKEEIISFLFCELVTNQYIYFGKMYFSKDYIIFESIEDPRNNINKDKEYDTFIKFAISTKNKDNANSNQKFILIFNDEIREIIKRRTLLINQSIEILKKNGKSYFFNFFKVKEVLKAYKYLNEINENLLTKNLPQFYFKANYEEDIKNILFSFRKGKISNYEYLLNLNKYSTRTYNDLSQYPVFPWLVFEHDKIEEIFTLMKNNDNNCSYLRDLNYPISLQTKEKRQIAYEKYISEEEKDHFSSHLYRHYSTSSYIYYYLMRMNPYSQNMIKLNKKFENPDRVFNSFSDLEQILSEDSDNRELIPDFCCYFDYFCNLNCSFLGEKSNGNINDDFDITKKISSKYINNISSYVYMIYTERKLINSFYISKSIYKWVDIIFGKKQLPTKKEEAEKCCNIYHKLSYEQKTNFENEFNKFEKSNDEKNKEFIDLMKNKIEIALNFGLTPKQILKESNPYEYEYKSINSINKVFIHGEDKLIFFKKLPNDYFLIVNEQKKKNKMKERSAIIYENKNFKSKPNISFDLKGFNLFKKNKNYLIKQKDINIKIPLYNQDYGISYLNLKIDKKNTPYIPIILTCRYYGNYFNIQTSDNILNIFCEAFVTCIKGRNIIPKGDPNFYTGLLNGKLIEWKVISFLKIKEIRHVYSHKSSITAIEIYPNQRIIITAGEDKFIHIRKINDFELLTVIDLTYSFGNPIISQTKNIFPSLIRISQLNLLYILLYDFDSNSTIIRGYNLNGLFFAQTNDKYFKGEYNNKLQINNISFTKNSNLVIGFYNSNNYAILQAWDLMPLFPFKNIQNIEDLHNNGNKLFEYDYSAGLFYILLDYEFVLMSPKDKDEQKNFEFI